MLATILPAAEVAPPMLSTAAAPSLVPLRFWEGDRVEEPGSGAALRRGPDGVWRPLMRSGSYAVLRPDVEFGATFEDDAIRAYLGRPGASESIRYSPRSVDSGTPLPGRWIADPVDLETLLGLGAVGAVPFAASSAGAFLGFWSLRDLVAERAGEEAAAYVPAALPMRDVVEALAVFMEEERAEVAFHRPAARFYARYETTVQDESGRWRPELRTHAYVLTGAGSR